MRDVLSRATKYADSNNKAQGDVNTSLQFLQHAKSLSSVRDPAELARLPQDEREEWSKFWNEVQALRQRLDIDWD